MIKVICDENITYAEEAFSGLGNLVLLPGRKIKNTHLLDADILIVRSVTNVNEELLKNSSVKFVGTATIGTDHLDKKYLEDSGIKYASAPGCNSFAVAEWVITSILFLINRFNLSPKTATVIGHGNIGSKVAPLITSLGIDVKIVDPPKAELENINNFYLLDEVLNSDIITFHTPMIKNGKYPTYHLMNIERLSSLKNDTILINTSRGAVVDNSALLDILDKTKLFTAFDVWENEPNINLELLEKINIATPHIAGYSLEGKVNGTKMIYDELYSYLSIENKWKPSLPEIDNCLIKSRSQNYYQFLFDLTKELYPIKNDDSALRKHPLQFDDLRKNYNARREFSNFKISKEDIPEKIQKALIPFRINLI